MSPMWKLEIEAFIIAFLLLALLILVGVAKP